MKRILFISINQFGYNTDLYKYSEYLTNTYDVYYLSINAGLPKVQTSKVNLVYLNRAKEGAKARLGLFYDSLRYIKRLNPNIVFMKYYAGCSILRLFYPNKKIVVDIRTATIDNDRKTREKKDKLISIEANLFNNISVISEGLLSKFSLNPNKTFILPLGADRVVKHKIQEKKMFLLYVGILDMRNLEDTILGFETFYKKYKDQLSCKYTIIGYSYKKEYEDKIVDIINTRNLQDVVHFAGRKKFDELTPYFEQNNIGVSYIPITDFFQHQPPTKTYEYIQNGLICIATNTLENRKVINDSNGVLINEGRDSFFEGLEKIYSRLESYNISKIMEDSNKYSWFNIVENILKPQLEKIK